MIITTVVISVLAILLAPILLIRFRKQWDRPPGRGFRDGPGQCRPRATQTVERFESPPRLHVRQCLGAARRAR